MCLSKNLCKKMEEQGMTPLQLSAACERLGEPVSGLTIQRAMDGFNEPRLAAFRVMCDALEVSMDELYPSRRTVAV